MYGFIRNLLQITWTGVTDAALRHHNLMIPATDYACAPERHQRHALQALDHLQIITCRLLQSRICVSLQVG